jgi:hypothetical protein
VLRLRAHRRIRFGERAERVYTLRVEAGCEATRAPPPHSLAAVRVTHDTSPLRSLSPPACPASAPAAGARAPPAKRPREGAPPDDGRVVRASHILVKHRDSRRASSWKEPVVTRSKEEAVALLHAFEARLAAGEVSFAALAEAESHCSSYKRGGDLGVFGRGKMQRPFEAAAFALEVGATSGVVDTDSGVHLILRTE